MGFPDAAQGGDGQEGRQAGWRCDGRASNAADVAHRPAGAASRRAGAVAGALQIASPCEEVWLAACVCLPSK